MNQQAERIKLTEGDTVAYFLSADQFEFGIVQEVTPSKQMAYLVNKEGNAIWNDKERNTKFLTRNLYHVIRDEQIDTLAKKLKEAACRSLINKLKEFCTFLIQGIGKDLYLFVPPSHKEQVKDVMRRHRGCGVTVIFKD